MLGTIGVTGFTGVDREDDDEVEFHTPHTEDEELEHCGDDVTVVVTVTGGMEM